MTTQNVIQAVATVVGYAVGGPQGAVYGFQIGTVVGALVQGPTEISGPNIGEPLMIAAAPDPTGDDGDEWGKL